MHTPSGAIYNISLQCKMCAFYSRMAPYRKPRLAAIVPNAIHVCVDTSISAKCQYRRAHMHRNCSTKTDDWQQSYQIGTILVCGYEKW